MEDLKLVILLDGPILVHVTGTQDRPILEVDMQNQVVTIITIDVVVMVMAIQ
jgi:hypothetical protein